MIRIVRSRKYEETLKKLLTDYKDIESIRTAIKIFSRKPVDTRLKTHALRKRLIGKYAFSVDNDVRVIFEWLGKNVVRFLTIGKHKDVYGKKIKMFRGRISRYHPSG